MLFTVSDNGIFTVNCELYILEKRNAVMQFIIDTGAAITCCRAKELGINLKEEEFIASRAAVKYLNGVLKETGNEYGKDIYSIKFYEVKMKKLKLGTSIILTNVSVWVTFDNRFYTCLMGQDILDKRKRWIACTYTKSEPSCIIESGWLGYTFITILFRLTAVFREIWRPWKQVFTKTPVSVIHMLWDFCQEIFKVFIWSQVICFGCFGYAVYDGA